MKKKKRQYFIGKINYLKKRNKTFNQEEEKNLALLSKPKLLGRSSDSQVSLFYSFIGDPLLQSNGRETNFPLNKGFRDETTNKKQ